MPSSTPKLYCLPSIPARQVTSASDLRSTTRPPSRHDRRDEQAAIIRYNRAIIGPSSGCRERAAKQPSAATSVGRGPEQARIRVEPARIPRTARRRSRDGWLLAPSGDGEKPPRRCQRGRTQNVTPCRNCAALYVTMTKVNDSTNLFSAPAKIHVRLLGF